MQEHNTDPNNVKKTNVIAIIGLIISIIGFIVGRWTYCIVPIIGFILSIIGLVRVKVCQTGRGLSIAGIILGSISIASWLMVLIITIVLT